MYDLYKPLRNYFRQFRTVESLFNIWAYSTHIANKVPISAQLLPPKQFSFSRPHDLLPYPWELDTLCKEIILNGDPTANNFLSNWNETANAINHLRSLGNDISGRYSNQEVILRDLLRIVHHQFPWQRPPNITSVHRYFQIFQQGDLSQIASERLGLPVSVFFKLGFAVAGNFVKRLGLSSKQDYNVINISPEHSKIFFQKVGISLENLKSKLTEYQKYDDSWEYTFNPLRSTPLIFFDPANQDRMICPIPEYMMRRITEGLFYDCAGHKDFGNAYGKAFEDYVRLVIDRVFEGAAFELYFESGYDDRAGRKHGVDAIISDDTATIYIECKTKRLSHDAKARADDELDRDIAIMAGFVVQNYKNILDIEGGKTKWVHESKPSFSLVMTLENWWLFSPPLFQRLDETISRKLSDASIDLEILERVPYALASIEDFEIASQVIRQTGILPFMRSKTDSDHRQWAIAGFLPSKYPEEMKKVRYQLFDVDLNKMFDGLPKNPTASQN